MESRAVGSETVTELSRRRQPDESPLLALGRPVLRIDAVSGNPQDLSAPIPGEPEWMQTLRQGGDGPARHGAGKDLAVEDARHPDCRPVACHAFNQTMPGIDREDRLRLDGRCRREGHHADQRSAPAINFCSLEWIADEPATYSPRSSARSAPR